MRAQRPRVWPSNSSTVRRPDEQRSPSWKHVRFALLVALALGCSSRPSSEPDASVVLRYPTVPTGGGAVLADTALVSVTFGPDTANHAAYVKWLAESGWLTERAGEYGVQRVTWGGAVELSAVLPATAGDEAVRNALEMTAVSKGKLYVVWLPEGITLIDHYGHRTCFSNPGTGYHEWLDAREVPYVAVPACPPRFGATLDLAGSMHFDASRLVVDALTNPSPRNAPAFAVDDASSVWAALGNEVGDFCWGRTVTRESALLQRVWSNAAVLRGDEPCQPTPPGAGPAFGLIVEPAGRRTMDIGVVQELTIRGWSSGPRDDWAIDVTPWTGDFTMNAMLDKATLNDGQTATLSLSVPFLVPKGTAGSVLLRSRGGDDSPLWPVSLVTR